MKTREQFGGYLLLKKLAEDALGETFRAGRLGNQGMEQVVLLRVFNGPGVEGGDLARKLAGRAELSKILRSPNIGECIDAGEVSSVPYVAYDYISGKNLASLFAQASKRRNPIPTDHALLIGERIALALTVAYETRLETTRILHGFLVPQLVMLSNEGENRLLGFEAAPGLRELVNRPATREHFGRYLSPESLAGEPIAKTDDIYSLGVILLELLIGEHLPAAGEDGYAPLIERAVLAAEGTQIPGALAALLRQSVAPRDERVQDVVTWHKSLTKLMIEGQYRPTTFNLAFFMHNLFREEIERESQEIEVEKTIELPVEELREQLSEIALDEPDLATVPAGGREDTSAAVRARYHLEEPSRKRPWLMAALAALAVTVLGAGGYFGYTWWQDRSEPAQPEILPAVTTPVEVITPLQSETGTVTAEAETEDAAEPQAPTGPTPDELEEQIARIIEDRTRSMEANLKAQYDQQIRSLQRQLEETRQEAAARAAVSEPTATPPVAARTGEPATPERREAAKVETERVTAQPEVQLPAVADTASAGAAAGHPPAQKQLETPRQTGATPSRSAAAGGGQQAAAETRPAAGGGQTTAGETPPAASSPVERITAPPPVRTRPGDLVVMGPGVRPPRIKRLPNPQYPMLAMKMRREAMVVVSVLVDENGSVLEAKLKDPKKAGYGFDEAALKAARQATFFPAVKDGVPVKIWSSVRIEFSLD